MISFAELLRKFGASAAVINEVKKEESGLSAAPAGKLYGGGTGSNFEQLLRLQPKISPVQQAVTSWLKSTVPMVAIAYSPGGVLIVSGSGGVDHYDLTWIPQSADASTLITAALNEARTNSLRRTGRSHLVLIAPNLAISADIELHMLRMDRYAHDPEIIIGVIGANGSFFPTYWGRHEDHPTENPE